jgi:pimeloyl-ACP methyl ester carboxylesterase
MAGFDPITGKYVYLDIQGNTYRVYFEENGKGIPIICQHTAAGDGQLYYNLLNDEEIASRFRMIAPDLPYHGKSFPPKSNEWWKQEYLLTKSFFIDFQVALSHALNLNKPVYMGCSIGGMLAPDLALEKPDEFRAVIGIGAGIYIGGAMDQLKWWIHPRINNNFRSILALHGSGPTSPELNKREITWVMNRSGTPVMKGDLYYYSCQHDLRGKTQQIDTSRIPVYLLTGEYDPSTSPEDSKQLADQIKGAKFIEMKGLGHFAVSENPAVFKKYLMPVLDEIAARNI